MVWLFILVVGLIVDLCGGVWVIIVGVVFYFVYFDVVFMCIYVIVVCVLLWGDVGEIWW